MGRIERGFMRLLGRAIEILAGQKIEELTDKQVTIWIVRIFFLAGVVLEVAAYLVENHSLSEFLASVGLILMIPGACHYFENKLSN